MTLPEGFISEMANRFDWSLDLLHRSRGASEPPCSPEEPR
jgi:hypothetical protein